MAFPFSTRWVPNITLALLAASSTGIADPGREDQSVGDRFAARQQDNGVRMGSFVLRPELNLELVHDDNIFSDNRNKESDLISRYAGSAQLTSDWSNHSLTAGASYDAERFADNPNEDSDDYQANVGGRVDLGTRTNLTSEVRYGSETLSRDSVESRNGIDRLEYDTTLIRLGLNRRFGKFTARAYGSHEKQDFDDSTIDTSITNQRDNKSKAVGVRLNYGDQRHRQYYVDLSHTRDDYEASLDSSDFDRSSKSKALALGSRFRFSDVLAGYAELGYLDKSYDEPFLDDQSGLLTDLGLIWNITKLTTITGSARRGFESTTLSDSSGYRDSKLGLVVDHELLRTLKISAGLYYNQEDYEQVDREESKFDYELSAEYQVGRNATLNLFHRSEQRDSSGADRGREYDGNLFGLGITLKR
ncbi:MAG: outer membrane beta-barrel protein [Pseudomonadales bacterium]